MRQQHIVNRFQNHFRPLNNEGPESLRRLRAIRGRGSPGESGAQRSLNVSNGGARRRGMIQSEQAAMKLHDIPATGLLLQAVDVLGDHRDFRDECLHPGDGMVAGVRLGLADKARTYCSCAHVSMAPERTARTR